ncbi:MAG: phosphoenolpyruvate synthase [Candidatus Pacearchaeota archaeon]
MEKEGSENKKDDSQRPDFVKWFSELNKSSGKIVGGKGANLSEIYNLKISVPPGFVVTAQAYDYFIKKADIDDKINKLLGSIDYEDTGQLTKVTKEIRDIIEKSNFPKEMEEEIIEAYETLGAEEEGIKNQHAHEIIKKPSEEPFVAVRSSATTEDLAEASFAGQQDTYLNVKGKTELLNSIRKCFASLFTTRATYYRNKKGFKHEEASLAVIVQKMVDAKKSGVIFSKDPSQKKENVIIEAVWGLGEGIVSGRISPDRHTLAKDPDDPHDPDDLKIIKKEIGKKKIAITRDSSGAKEVVKLNEDISERQVLKEHEVKKLAEIALKLEDHYKKPQDIEFAIEDDEIYIVQTRPITTMESRGEADEEHELKGDVVLKGLAASPGIGSGKVRIIKDISDLEKIREGDILVTSMTNPDMVVTMQKSAAIVTDEGGLTAHASIVSREMGIPAIVGTQEATTKLKDGETITVNGYTGKIYKGKVAESEQKEIKPVTAETKTKIKVIVDLPSFAKRAAETKLTGVGLARMEGIIAESGKHPAYFRDKEKTKDYEELIFDGISKIAKYFEELWVRTSDIRSDEFRELEGSPKEKEANPMLGMHGIRYSLKNPEIFKAELNAMKRVSEKDKKIGILLPQVISIEEIKKVKEILKEINFTKAKIGVMIETPASVQIIEEICEEGVDFISFGTNDLTQYTLAIDRGNRQVQNIYNELHPAVLHQLEHVIKVCKENETETSICGQAGSKKEMAKFLVEQGIDSISTNADMASTIAEYVSGLEKGEESENKDDENKQSKEIEDKSIPEKNLTESETEQEETSGQEEQEKEEIETEDEEIENEGESENEKVPEESPEEDKEVDEGEDKDENKDENHSSEKKEPGEEIEDMGKVQETEKPEETSKQEEQGDEMEEKQSEQSRDEDNDDESESNENGEKNKYWEKQPEEKSPKEDEEKEEEDELPSINGAEPPEKEESEEDLLEDELGVINNVKENVERGKDAVENIVDSASGDNSKTEEETENEEKNDNRKSTEDKTNEGEENKKDNKSNEEKDDRNDEVLDIF